LRVLVAGCGFAGTAIAERFAASGDEVWGLRRKPIALPAGVRAVAADVTEQASLVALPEGLDLVVYSAAPDRGDATAYEQTYIRGLGNLLLELRRRGSRLHRIVLTSSTGVYGQTDGSWVDETTSPAPRSEKSDILLRAEHLLLDSGWPATVVRLGGIYGPGRQRLIDNVRSGKEECVAGLTQYTNRIHRDDVAGVVFHLTKRELPHELYLGVDCLPAERCEVLRWLAAQLKAPAPRTRAATNRDAQTNKRCSNRRLLTCGYEFRFPSYREGYADVLSHLT
jgi:nucleoside-diphosphate-sugar epimerase